VVDLYFTKPDTWAGGHYELALEIGPSPTSEELLFSALTALWQHPTLEGCYLDRETEPSDQQRISPSKEFLEAGSHLLGIASLPNGKRLACGTFLMREYDGSDWLTLYIPLGALHEAYPEVGGYPFGDLESANLWQDPIEHWLASIGMFIFQSTPFSLGIMGQEVPVEWSVTDFEENGIPAKRWVGYLWPSEGKLGYFPRTDLYGEK
jgi:hypothetical protein